MNCSTTALSSTCQIYATGKVSITTRRTSVNELLAAAVSRPSIHPRRATTPAAITSKDIFNNEKRPSFTLVSFVRRYLYTTNKRKQQRRRQKDQEYQQDKKNINNKLISYSANLNDYEKLHVLGVGGTATVYACKHKPTKTTVAVKQIDLELLDVSHESKRLEGLRREIQIMKLCRHQHLLPTFQSFVHSSYLYIIMPMMPFGSCRDLLTNFFPEGLDERLIACIIKQVISGLQYLHENGLLHRDIKSANLLLESGTVRLADFGVSNHLLSSTTTTSEQGETPSLRRARRKSFVGTPCWMAPEILQHHEYNQKVDIWALGITTFELASGWPPLCEHDAASIFSHVIHDPPPILESNDNSPACHDFIACCLRKCPNERISANEASYHPFLVQAPPSTYLKQFLQQLDWPTPGSCYYTNDNDLSNNHHTTHSFVSTDFLPLPPPSSSSLSSSSSSRRDRMSYDINNDHSDPSINSSIDWDFSDRPLSPLLLLPSPPPQPPLTPPTVRCSPPSFYDNDSLYDDSAPVTPEDETASLSKPLVHDRMLLLDTPSDFRLF